ncbi:hypothetical protein RCL1_003345 [Eukaryota sp. TZLM3-RCL]
MLVRFITPESNTPLVTSVASDVPLNTSFSTLSLRLDVSISELSEYFFYLCKSQRDFTPVSSIDINETIDSLNLRPGCLILISKTSLQLSSSPTPPTPHVPLHTPKKSIPSSPSLTPKPPSSPLLPPTKPAITTSSVEVQSEMIVSEDKSTFASIPCQNCQARSQVKSDSHCTQTCIETTFTDRSSSPIIFDRVNESQDTFFEDSLSDISFNSCSVVNSSNFGSEISDSRPSTPLPLPEISVNLSDLLPSPQFSSTPMSTLNFPVSKSVLEDLKPPPLASEKRLGFNYSQQIPPKFLTPKPLVKATSKIKELSRVIKVHPLPPFLSDTSILISSFSTFGGIIDCKIEKNSKYLSALLTFTNNLSCVSAAKAFNNFKFSDGSIINVEIYDNLS